MSHPDASANPVSLKVGAASYRTSDSISVILSNQGAQSISFADHQTNCTVMLVEYQVNGTWTPIKNCARKSRTVWHTLAVGEHLEVELDAPKSGWPVGLYRVTLSYRTDQNASLLTMIYSISFYVVAS